MAAEAGIVAQGTGRGGSTVSGGGGGGGGAGFDPALWPVGREGFNPKVDHGHCASWVVAQLRDRVRWVPGLAMRGWSGRFVHRDEDTLAWHSEEAAHWQVMADAEKIIEDLVLRRLRLRPTVVTSMLSRDYLHAVCRLISETRIDLHRGLECWDEDADVLQTPASVWSLQTGHRRAVTLADFNLQCTRVEPGAMGSAVRFTGMLDSAFGQGTDNRRWFEDLVGGSLFGHNAEQLLAWLIGRSGTGKSTIMSVVVRVLGSYATVGDSSLLVRDSRQGAGRASQAERFQLAALERRRVVVFEEIREKHGVLNAALIKRLVSSAEITIEEKYGTPRAGRLCLTPWLITNGLPDKGLDGDDGGSILRRLGLVSADGLPGVVEAGLGDWIVAHEAEGVLAWLIDCAARHIMFGPVARPVLSEMASQDFTEEGRPVEDWFAERIEFTGNKADRLHARVMFDDFEEHGAGGVSHANFYRRLSVLIIEDAGKGDRTLHNPKMEIDGTTRSGYYNVRLRETVENGPQNRF